MTFNEIVDMKEKLKDAVIEYWLQNTLFRWEWWVLLFLTIIPWLVMWRVLDKKRSYEILTYGFLVAIITIFVDDMGTYLVWWYYPHTLISVVLPLVPVDLAIVPCSMMIIYQYFGRWKSYLAAILGLSLFSSYIGERLFILVDFYRLNTWKPFYSVIFFMITGILAKWFVERIRPIDHS